jgi:hypothetical protein
MIQEMLWHLDGAERKAGLLDSPLDLERDLIARYVFTGIDFLTDIYNEFGGYEAFTRVNNVETMSEHFTPVRKILNTSVKALTFLHYGADSYLDPILDFQPSLNRAVSIFKELKKVDYAAFQENFVSRSLLHEHWSGTKETLALLYSASTIKVGRKSLLQVLMSLNSTHEQTSKYLQIWLGRARYVSDHIFANMADLELSVASDHVLPSIIPLPFSPPELSSLELTILRSQFRKKLV